MILFAYKTAMGLDKKLLQLMDGSFPNFLLVEENQRSAASPGVSKWAGTQYFYPSEIVYSTGRNY